MINSIPFIRKLAFRGSETSIPLSEALVKTLPPELRRFAADIKSNEPVRGSEEVVKLACFLSNDKVRSGDEPEVIFVLL